MFGYSYMVASPKKKYEDADSGQKDSGFVKDCVRETEEKVQKTGVEG